MPSQSAIQKPSARCRLGLKLLSAGRLDAASVEFEAALAAKPGFFEACFNLAFIRHRQGETDRAIALYRRTIELDPACIGAHNNLAVLLRERGESDEAASSFRRVLALDPANADAHAALADLLRDLGRFSESIDLYRTALTLRPGDTKMAFGLGSVLVKAARYEEGLAELDLAIEARHDFVEAHINRAIALRCLDRTEEALCAFGIAIALDPGNMRTHIAKGNVLADLARFDWAEVAYRQALSLTPDSVEAGARLGMVLTRLDRLDEAIPLLEHVCEKEPNHAAYADHLGNAYAKADRFDEALACFRRALDLDPHQAVSWCNLGVMLQDLRRFDEALDCYDTARKVEPGLALADYNESAIRLVRGEFASGWELYEARLRLPDRKQHVRHFDRPRWTGSASLTGHTILIHAEQGMGDTIQFARFLRALADRAGHVLALVPKPLRRLIESADRRVTVLDDEGTLPAFDLHCPLMSLPAALGTVIETIPAEAPYLEAPADRIAYWRRRRPTSARRPRIGLAWAGNPAQIRDRHRSIPFAAMAPLLSVPGVEFISLQKDIRDTDRAAYDAETGLLKPSETLDDFADTAGLIATLDLVITVDTSIAHLAGALGIPVWIMITWTPEWRWLLDRADSPWYLTARLFRQSSQGDWPGVIDAVIAARPERQNRSPGKIFWTQNRQ